MELVLILGGANRGCILEINIHRDLARAIGGDLLLEEVQHLGLAVEGGGRREVEATGVEILLEVRARQQAVHVHRQLGGDVAVSARRYGVAPERRLRRRRAAVGYVGGGVVVGEAGAVRVLHRQGEAEGDVEMRRDEHEIHVL